jgi:hypothetical protein
VGTGYTQRVGSLKSGVGLPSVVTLGIGVDLQLGYRADANWAVLWSGEFQDFTAERAPSARGFTMSVVMQCHITPMQRLDPWIEAGAGYRSLSEYPSIGPTLTLGTNISDPRYSMFIFAGVQGRFDVGGSTISPPARGSKR